jgi:predicted Rossmann fold nucleotide-binding protein DprA/Smf involved in DNA uptake
VTRIHVRTPDCAFVKLGFYDLARQGKVPANGVYPNADVPGKQTRTRHVFIHHKQLRTPMDIKATIGQLTAERDKLDKAIQALQALENASDPAPRRTAPRTTRARRTRATATSNGASARGTALTPAKVVSLVTTDGVAASAIRQQTGGSADAVLRVLKQLESDGAVKRTGARRSTKWHLTGK